LAVMLRELVLILRQIRKLRKSGTFLAITKGLRPCGANQMPILGFRHTANFVTNERPENWRQAILREYPNGTAPLFALTSLMKSESTDDPVFHWWQKNFDNRRLKFCGALTNVATAVTV